MTDLVTFEYVDGQRWSQLPRHLAEAMERETVDWQGKRVQLGRIVTGGLDDHQPSIRQQDEDEMDARLEGSIPDHLEWADYALRTCSCGVRLNGFDEYHAHLKEVLA